MPNCIKSIITFPSQSIYIYQFHTPKLRTSKYIHTEHKHKHSRSTRIIFTFVSRLNKKSLFVMLKSFLFVLILSFLLIPSASFSTWFLPPSAYVFAYREEVAFLFRVIWQLFDNKQTKEKQNKWNEMWCHVASSMCNTSLIAYFTRSNYGVFLLLAKCYASSELRDKEK